MSPSISSSEGKGFYHSIVESETVNMGTPGRRKPVLSGVRSSNVFITFVVAYAVFVVSLTVHCLVHHRVPTKDRALLKDQLIFTSVLPLVPFTLHQRAGVAEADVPFWNTMFLVVFGIFSLISSCTSLS